MIDDYFVRPATRLRADLIDTRSGQTRDWDNAAELAMKGWLSQATAIEDEDTPGRDARITGTVLVLPADTDVLATDRVSIDGQVYDVDGPPNRPWTPDGEHHVLVQLRLVEG